MQKYLKQLSMNNTEFQFCLGVKYPNCPVVLSGVIKFYDLDLEYIWPKQNKDEGTTYYELKKSSKYRFSVFRNLILS